MAGVEIAGLALGALPVILEAIKGYREAYNHVQTYKHATKQLQIIDAQFRVCRLNFLSECRLLLDVVLFDPHLAKEMMADLDHRLWQQDTAKQPLNDLQNENVHACSTIVADAHATIRKFIVRLFKVQASTPNSGKNTLRRARVSAAFMMQKSRFERDIATLRQRNADLNLLRTQLTALWPRIHSASQVSVDATESVGRFSRIRLASGLLHDTLKGSWSCSDQSHLQHWVKLGVDSDAQSTPHLVTLDMAISYETTTLSQRNATIWLFVRSESRNADSRISDDSFSDLVQSLQLHTPIHASSSQTTPRVPASTVASSVTSLAAEEVDLCKVTCVCSHFQQSNRPSGSQHHSKCLGYLESSDHARHRFYPPPIQKRFRPTSVNSTEEITDLISIIEQSQKSSLELLHQYHLALKVATGVLQFHSTAWLSPTWTLQDISIFGTKLSDDTMKSLHLSVRFETNTTIAIHDQAQNQGDSVTSATNGHATSPLSPVDACCKQFSPGIYNVTLFSLGIALLEIAHWQSFQTLTQHDPDEFYAAHRLVRGPAPLGPKYRKVVERCIRCDFEAGSENLDDASLQHAVWSKAVYPLEALIRDTSQAV
ncbi:hypothetical protein CC80DRAFT_547994 [Byssothecium circinans]|uniref:DUF7580 domain-containing protein n=1 Tax=Byssothecium circinans TaxID=147558 RepID=A0A6A5TW12_9PLEO|nr:hypothetical protein CC80DRAFT_547994 [Byssothecium circinans]